MIRAVLIHNPLKWYNPETWLYALIRLATGSRWNHAAVYVDNEDGKRFVIDANFHGVVIKNREGLYPNLKRTIAVLTIPDDVSEEILRDRLKAQYGRKYDYLIYLRYFLPFLGKSKNKLYCFALLGKVWKEQIPQDKILTGKDFEQYINYYINI